LGKGRTGCWARAVVHTASKEADAATKSNKDFCMV
jgi:hypothetical protein